MIGAIAVILPLSLLATKPLTNQAFAKCESSLSLVANPTKGTVGTITGTLPVSLSGELTCGGPIRYVEGASITITGTGEGSKHVTTNFFGS